MHEGPIKVEKSLAEWSREERKLHQLEYLARDIIVSTLDASMLSGISWCNSAVEIMDHLNRLSIQADQTLPDRNEPIKMEEGVSSSSSEDKGYDQEESALMANEENNDEVSDASCSAFHTDESDDFDSEVTLDSLTEEIN